MTPHDFTGVRIGFYFPDTRASRPVLTDIEARRFFGCRMKQRPFGLALVVTSANDLKL